MSRPVLFIGEAPGRRGPRKMDVAFACKAVGGVRDVVTLRARAPEVADLLRRSRHRNLLDYWPGTDGNGSYFPIALAREKVAKLRIPQQVHTIVLLGMRVAQAFGHVHVHRGPTYLAPFFERRTWKNRLIYVVPHPSGVNHWWNDPDNRWKARCFLEEL